jgi:hypothetical protein
MWGLAAATPSKIEMLSMFGRRPFAFFHAQPKGLAGQAEFFALCFR